MTLVQVALRKSASCTSTLTSAQGSHFKDDGTVDGHALGASTISGSIGAVHGAGSVSIAAGTTGLVVFGSGDNKDDVTILSAQVQLAIKDAAGNLAVDEPANIAVS